MTEQTAKIFMRAALKKLVDAAVLLRAVDFPIDCPDCGGLPATIKELEAELARSGPTSFNFGHNVKPSKRARPHHCTD